MSKKIWTVKFKPSDHVGIKIDDYSPRTRKDAIDTARFLAGRNCKWHVWVERTHGVGMNYMASEKIWEYNNGIFNIGKWKAS